MTTGNDFKIKLNRVAIAQIYEQSKQLRITDVDFIRQAPYEDVFTAYILLSLQEFLAERRCQPDFEVCLNE